MQNLTSSGSVADEANNMGGDEAPVWRGLFSRSLLRKIAPLWIVVVIVGSFMPYSFKRDIGTTLELTTGNIADEVTMRHRLVHFVLFGVTSAVLVLIGRSLTVRSAALIAVLSLAFSIEFTQNLMDHYGVEWWDVRDDFTGAALVFLVLLSPGLRRLLVRD